MTRLCVVPVNQSISMAAELLRTVLCELCHRNSTYLQTPFHFYALQCDHTSDMDTVIEQKQVVTHAAPRSPVNASNNDVRDQRLNVSRVLHLTRKSMLQHGENDPQPGEHYDFHHS